MQRSFIGFCNFQIIYHLKMPFVHHCVPSAFGVLGLSNCPGLRVTRRVIIALSLHPELASFVKTCECTLNIATKPHL